MAITSSSAGLCSFWRSCIQRLPVRTRDALEDIFCFPIGLPFAGGHDAIPNSLLNLRYDSSPSSKEPARRGRSPAFSLSRLTHCLHLSSTKQRSALKCQQWNWVVARKGLRFDKTRVHSSEANALEEHSGANCPPVYTLWLFLV